MSGNKNLFSSFKPTSGVTIGGVGGSAVATGTGAIHIQLENGTKFSLSDVLFVDGLQTTLISTSRLYANSWINNCFRSKRTHFI